METATISVIMPVYNAADSLSSSLASLIAQQFKHWELVAVDDGSTDESYELLTQWEARDARIKVVRSASNRGPSAARNAALRVATGDFIAYLDADDEFYPDFLATVDRFRDDGDVLIFGYDVLEEKGTQQIRSTWDPTPYREILFAGNLATPLGIAHHRHLGEQISGFNEELWGLEDWDLLKRMARAGAQFLFLPFRSGLYHIREGSRSRRPRLTEKQQSAFMTRRCAGAPLYGSAGGSWQPVSKVLLLTPVFPFDSQSAAVQDPACVANLLTSTDITAQGFCVSKLAGESEIDFEPALEALGLPIQAQDTQWGPHAARMVYTRKGNVAVSVFRTHSTRPSEYRDREGGAVLDYFEKFLTTYQPGAVFACNPGPRPDVIFDLMFHMAKTRDIPMVLWLDDASAINLSVLQNCDYCVVNSEHLRQRYWEGIGLVCHVLPPAFDWNQVHPLVRNPTFVTILSALSPAESLITSKIVEKLTRRRPDIPIVTLRDGRMRREGLADVHGLPTALPDGAAGDLSTADVQSATRILVVPSLGHGLFDRTTAEAMINGIPVLTSNRGALPEFVGNAGVVIDIPLRYSSEAPIVPYADDIQPWVDAVIRLWDDPAGFQQASQRVAEAALRWHPEHTLPVYSEFFRNLRPQPGPPLLPRQRDQGGS